MRSSVVLLADRRHAGTARDVALLRLGRARQLLTVGTIGLAGVFTALAAAATPAYNKHRAATGRRGSVIHPSSAWPHPKRHHRRRRVSASPAPASSPSSQAQQLQPPASAPAPPPAPAPAPAPVQQAPAVTSGGS